MEIGEVESELNRVHNEFQDTRELLFSVLGEIIKKRKYPFNVVDELGDKREFVYKTMDELQEKQELIKTLWNIRAQLQTMKGDFTTIQPPVKIQKF